MFHQSNQFLTNFDISENLRRFCHVQNSHWPETMSLHLWNTIRVTLLVKSLPSTSQSLSSSSLIPASAMALITTYFFFSAFQYVFLEAFLTSFFLTGLTDGRLWTVAADLLEHLVLLTGMEVGRVIVMASMFTSRVTENDKQFLVKVHLCLICSYIFIDSCFLNSIIIL